MNNVFLFVIFDLFFHYINMCILFLVKEMKKKKIKLIKHDFFFFLLEFTIYLYLFIYID